MQTARRRLQEIPRAAESAIFFQAIIVIDCPTGPRAGGWRERCAVDDADRGSPGAEALLDAFGVTGAERAVLREWIEMDLGPEDVAAFLDSLRAPLGAAGP